MLINNGIKLSTKNPDSHGKPSGKTLHASMRTYSKLNWTEIFKLLITIEIIVYGFTDGGDKWVHLNTIFGNFLFWLTKSYRILWTCNWMAVIICYFKGNKKRVHRTWDALTNQMWPIIWPGHADGHRVKLHTMHVEGTKIYKSLSYITSSILEDWFYFLLWRNVVLQTIAAHEYDILLFQGILVSVNSVNHSTCVFMHSANNKPTHFAFISHPIQINSEK